MMLMFTGVFCIFCASLLKIDKKRPSLVTVYSANGSYQTQHIIKICDKKSCRTHYHYSFYTKYQTFFSDSMLARFFYNDCLDKPLFLVSSCSAFDMEFLRSFYSDMYLCPEFSFYQKATSFNINVPTGNVTMDRRRFTEAFFQLSLLEMANFFDPDASLSSLCFSFNLDLNINKIMPRLKQQFQTFYSKHRCQINGCGKVLGFDADCKVSRFSI